LVFYSVCAGFDEGSLSDLAGRTGLLSISCLE
jgi:hypothetical protein